MNSIPPGFPDARPQLMVQLENLDTAFAWLNTAIEQQLPAARLLNNPGTERFRMDPRFGEASKDLEASDRPTPPAQKADEGRALAFTGKPADALRRIQTAIDESPNDVRMARWLESLAWAHFANQDYAKAADFATRCLENQLSDHAEAFANIILAASHAHLGNAEPANQSRQRVFELWPTLEFNRDLAPLFTGGGAAMRDALAQGLTEAGG